MSGVPGQAGPYLTFHYQVIRVWELPVERVLTGGLGTLPLAPISNVTAEEVPRTLRRVQERLLREESRARAAKLWTATFILMGLRYEQAFTVRLFEEVGTMEESVTYQWIVSKGEK